MEIQETTDLTSPDLASFEQILESMAGAGFFTGLLPFVIAYLLFFLTLQRVPLFEEDKQDKFAALVSIVFAFFVARFVTENEVYQQFFVDYLGFVAITIIGLLGLLIVLAMVGIGVSDSNDNLWGVILALIVLTGFFVTGGPNVLIPDDLGADTSVVTEAAAFVVESGLIWILLVSGVIYWTLSDGESSGTDREFPTLFDGLTGNSGE